MSRPSIGFQKPRHARNYSELQKTTAPFVITHTFRSPSFKETSIVYRSSRFFDFAEWAGTYTNSFVQEPDHCHKFYALGHEVTREYIERLRPIIRASGQAFDVEAVKAIMEGK